MVKPHTSNMAYRADVDGLRAFAVLSVILFHVDPAWAPGGFIGVDVFFVISGFLITGVITKERQAGTFTYAEFYRRRIKRLFPVLFTVIGVTLLAGQIILNEADNERLVTSAVASAFFAANIFFTYSLDAGYFANDAAFEPLLHLWSLGVEEQFYIVWPAVIGIAGAGWVTRRSGVAIMAVLALLSFVLARLVVVDHPMFAYYMLPTRAGELLLGAIAFALIHNGAAARVSRAGREALSWGGAAAIAWSVIYLNEESLFPGLTAIPATAGAAAIILAGAPGATSLGRLLALRPIVWVGLLSYSLYLWHWPVLAYAKYMHGELALDYRIAALAVIFALSAGSYFLIEKPVRRSRAGLGRLAMLGFAAPTAAVALVAAGVLATNGYSWRAWDEQYRAQTQAFTDGETPAIRLPYVCQRPQLDTNMLRRPDCLVNTASESGVLVWGDSNSSHYVPALRMFAETHDFGFRNLAHSACPPLMQDAERFAQASRREACARSASMMSATAHTYQAVILSASWDTYLNRDDELLLARLEETLRSLRQAGVEVIVLGRVSRLPGLDPLCERKQLRLPFVDCGRRSVEPRRRVNAVNERIQHVAEASGAAYFDFNDALCTESECGASVNGLLSYYDAGHLSAFGSARVGEHLARSERVRDVFAPLAGFRARPSQFDWDGLAWTDLLDTNRSDGGVRLEDRASDDYQDRRIYQTPEGGLLALAPMDAYALRAVMNGEGDNTEALIRVERFVDDERLRFDIIIDFASRAVRTRGAPPELLDFQFDEFGALTLSAVFPPAPRSGRFEVRLFPAATARVGANYSMESEGVLEVLRLQTAVFARAEGET